MLSAVSTRISFSFSSLYFRPIQSANFAILELNYGKYSWKYEIKRRWHARSWIPARLAGADRKTAHVNCKISTNKAYLMFCNMQPVYLSHSTLPLPCPLLFCEFSDFSIVYFLNQVSPRVKIHSQILSSNRGRYNKLILCFLTRK